jgi:hypothetical protein
MESNNKQPSKGLGDTIAKVTNFFGIDKVADAAAKLLGAEGCGCKERRELLNHLFPYESSARHFEVKEQFTFLGKEYFKDQHIKITKADNVYHNVIQLVQNGKLEEII